MIKKRICNICGIDILTPKGVKGYIEYENCKQVNYPSLIVHNDEEVLMVHFCVNFHTSGDMCEKCAIKAIKDAAKKLKEN